MNVAIPISEIAAKIRSTCPFFTLNSVPSGGTIESSKTGPIRGSQYAAGSTVNELTEVNVVEVHVVEVHVVDVVDVVVVDPTRGALRDFLPVSCSNSSSSSGISG